MRRIALLSVICLLLAVLPGCNKKDPTPVLPGTSMAPVGPGEQPVFYSASMGSYRNMVDGAAPGVGTGTPEAGGATPREVVEPDVIRRDGKFLYVLNQYRGLTVVDLDQQAVVGRVPTVGYPRDLYLKNGRAYVLVGYAADIVQEQGLLRYKVGARIYVVDVSQPTVPALQGSIELSGDFVDSRLVGDALYAVCANFTYTWPGGGGTVSSGSAGTGTVTSPVPVKDQTSSSWVTSVNLADPTNLKPVDTVEFDGYGSIIQASSSALFVAAPDWNTSTTAITHIDISDPAGKIAVRGAITVPGLVADRFKMDAWNGVLRVVSNSWSPNETHVTTVSLANPDALAVLGQVTLENASGDTLFATRFDGPRAYIVTYFRVDPLFVVDLSDPATPKVAGELTVPGWSTYIEPMGDRLVAIGVDDTNGRRVSVSLFDVTDPANPGLIKRVSFGDNWSWSNAYSDVKAFTVLSDKLIVPFSGWNENGGGYDRLQFLSWGHDSLELQGYVDVQGGVLRSFDYGSLYFGVTTEEVAVIDGSNLAAPKVTNHVVLAEYIADFQPLGAGTGVEVVSRFNNSTTTVRAVDAAGTAMGAVELPGGSLMNSFAVPGGVVLVFSGYATTGDYHGYYDVYRVDCSNPAALAVAWSARVDVNPWWGGWWYYDVMPMVGAPGVGATAPGSGAAVPAKIASVMMPYWGGPPWWGGNNGDSAVLSGERLVLRCTATKYDSVLGSGDPSQGLAVLNVTSGALTGVVGLAYENVAAVNGAPDGIYVTTGKQAGSNSTGQSLCAYYLQKFDPVTLAMGTAANVPGVFLQRDAATGVILLQDSQWDGAGNYINKLNTLSWDGGGGLVTYLSTIDAPASAGAFKARGAGVYYSYWDNTNYGVGVIDIGANGALTKGPTLTISDGWVDITDARDGIVYLTVGGQAIARYDFSGATPSLIDVTPVMSSPLAIRFDAASAYAPLGYAGLAVLPR